MSVIGNAALRFDDEQAMLLDYARAFCAEVGGSAAARERLESTQDFTPELWQRMVDMGWCGIGLPESAGGSGLGIGAAVPVFESMGRSLLGTPLMSALLAAQLLLRADADGEHRDLLAAIGAGSRAVVAGAQSRPAEVDDQGAVRGELRLVMDAASADTLLVIGQRAAAPVIAVVARDDLPPDALDPCTLIDLTHRAADLRLDGVPARALIAGPAVAAAIADYRLLGALLVAAESSGAAAACLETVVDYLKTRRQFGRLIGSYQALKHPAVEMLTAVDSSRSFIYHAATLVDGQGLGRDAEIACRMAKAQATDALKFAADRAVQFHGGMGFTWDCDAQLYLRRAQWAQQQFGDAQHHRRRLAALLLD
jgi:alkylation response protein AidB-like acyl-CoA dehydrogenase